MNACLERRCATCMHWNRQGPQIANATRDPSVPSEEGTCEARSPVVIDVEAGTSRASARWPVSLFPRTHESRGCGEWEPRSDVGPDGGEEADVVTPFRRIAA